MGIPFEREAAAQLVGRALGYGRVGRRIQERVAAELTVAVRRRVLKTEGGLLMLDCRRIDDYTRAEQTAALLAAMGRGWIERAEAIRAAARYLGFQRAGAAIRAAFKSVITGALRRGWLEADGDLIRKTRGDG